MESLFLGVVIGVAFCAWFPVIPLKLRSLLGWDKKDKDKEDKK